MEMEEKNLDGMMDVLFVPDAGNAVDTVTLGEVQPPGKQKPDQPQPQPPSEPPKDAPPAKDAPPPEHEGRPRQADGKFAPKEPAAPEAATQPPASKPSINAEEFKGYLDERDKRQRAERERDELRARLQPTNIPSIHDDPEGYAEHLRQETARVATNERFSISEIMAAEKHGEPVVKAAMDWGMQRAQESPAFAAEYLKQRHPIDWAVRQKKLDCLMKELGDDPDAYVLKRWAELNSAAPPPQPSPAASPQHAAPAQPRPSIVDAPTAGGMTSQPAGWDAPFDGLFKRTG